MPVYAYECKNCHHAFDIRQSFSDDALTECPSCHEPALQKKFGAVGVSFKGSGFYRNDSRSSRGSSESSSSASGTDSGSGSSSSSSE